VPRVQNRGLHGPVDSPIVIIDDQVDPDGDDILLANLRCDLRVGEVSWTIYRQAGTQYASGRLGSYSEVRELLSDAEDAERLDNMRESYKAMFDAVGMETPSL
jgi:hypothetical protein